MALVNRLIECMLENNENCKESVIQVLNSVKSYEKLLPMENIIVVLKDEDVMNKFYKVQYELKHVKCMRDIRTYFPPSSLSSSSSSLHAS